MQKFPVGFDIGTTISVAAYVDQSGTPQVVKQTASTGLVPSAIFFDREPIVGKQAVELSVQSLDNYAEGFKRDVGKPHYRKRINGLDIPPEILTAFLVEHLTNQTRHLVGELSEVVVTVPAYFDQRQRSATQRAVSITGLNVLDVINEPTAAAIAAGYELIRAGETDTKRRILVYDLGGGTFDATLLEIDGRIFRTLGTDGDIYLGGRDFDERIATNIAETFIDRHGIDPRCDPSDLLRLDQLATQIKHALSQSESFDVSFQHAGLLCGFSFGRRLFESLVGPLVERTIMTAQSVISEAGFDWPDVDEILLVGGSSRIPLVRKRLESETQTPVRMVSDPDTSIAKGAALFAALRSETDYLDEASKFDVVNVNAHSLGIQGFDPDTQQRVNKIILPRNTPLPATATQVFTTMADGQPNVRVRLLEGESENPLFCTALGQCVVHLDPSLAKGTEVRVSCSYDASGNITVASNVPATKASAFVELRREGFAELDSLDSWRRRIAGDEAGEGSLDASATPLPKIVMLNEDSSLEELLERLDQIYAYVGRSVSDQAVPTEAIATQRLAKTLQAETNTLKRLIALLGLKQQSKKTPLEKMQLQGDVARVRMAWDQSNKLLQHSCISLGRTYLRFSNADTIENVSFQEVERLQQWIQRQLDAQQ
ncbi:Hsp70 family protein [Neorhodopirellula pilleata]|uniref:Chaperone protein DnaK n=1 Tax=Neorhodopirellula pilleata TaxID=2714738 RepID=A0A5C6AX18_9BACT|nr:Hsp70 family protein [Neorhodopirellula pilleata]TWU03699.1 Chaperone protein DnaK [Neorhodopirellula pilleata]